MHRIALHLFSATALLLSCFCLTASDLEVKWLEPSASPGSCPAYEKLEVGISLPDTFDRLIAFHMRESRHPLARNPFDPEVFDVWAEISYETKPGVWESERINCFYYIDYRRNHNYTEDFLQKVPSTNPADHYGTWDWIKQESNYNFRMRYAPRKPGNYKVIITCMIDRHTLVSDEMTFACVASDHPGYVKRSPQVGYLEHEDGSPYFPAGHQVNAMDRLMDWDLPWAKCQVYDENCQPVYELNGKGERIPKKGKCCTECVPSKQPWSEIEGGREPIAQISFCNMLDDLRDLKAGGGNTARVMFFPWTHELEYAKLGSYQNRMHNAWEFDQFLDKAAELDIHVQWNTQAQYVLDFNPFGIFQHWDWEVNYPPEDGTEDLGYCYNTELKLSEPLEFFTNPKAIKQYQKKLRYYIARWGYSPEISIIELFSEVNSIKKIDSKRGKIDLYKTGEASAREALANWHHAMADYIKNDLGHTQHLLGTSYLLNGPSPGDNTYADQLLDVICESRYNGGRDEFWKAGPRHVEGLQDKFDKPVIWSEFGHDHKYLNCERPVNAIKGMMLTPFSGTAGIGCDWDNMSNPDKEHWKYYAHISKFFEGVDLNKSSWSPTVADIRADEKALTTYLECSDGRVVGAVYNCTWNERSANGCATYGCKECPCDTSIWAFDGSEMSWVGLDKPVMISSVKPKKANKLRISKVKRGRYELTWYDPFSGSYFKQKQGAKAKLELIGGKFSRNIILQFPNLNPEKHPILYFTMKPLN